MIWYSVPVYLRVTAALLLLLTLVMQAVVIMYNRYFYTQNRATPITAGFYAALALSTLSIWAELMWVHLSIFESTFLPTNPWFRYVSVLAPLIWLIITLRGEHMPALLKITSVKALMPLLRLPMIDQLPLLISATLAFVAICYYFLDALFTCRNLAKLAQTNLTTDALREMVQHIDQGICIAAADGTFLESNLAFDGLIEQLGLSNCRDYAQLQTALEAAATYDCSSQVVHDLAWRIKDKAYFLRREKFAIGKKTFLQIALSDVTRLDSANAALIQENQQLAAANQSLQDTIELVTQQAALKERQSIRMAAHDWWAQNLTLAGAALDLLMKSGQPQAGLGLKEINSILSRTRGSHGNQHLDLPAVIKILVESYASIGVKVRVAGAMDFEPELQTTVGTILREACANAVRHAYAQSIEVYLEQNSQFYLVEVSNDCLADIAPIRPGLGLEGLRQLTAAQGGSFQCWHDDKFHIQATFPRGQYIREGTSECAY